MPLFSSLTVNTPDTSDALPPLLPVNGREVLFDGDNPPTNLKEIPVYFPGNALADLFLRLRRRAVDSWEWFTLRALAEELIVKPGFERLVVLDHLQERWRQCGMVLYPHQLQTAERVIRELHGKAILADEVGLGKTIEAGLILKEYQLRGLVKKALILVPASLCRQWQQELYEKFGISAPINREPSAWEQCDCVIASLDTAKRAAHQEALLQIPFDMVIIDEAHKLKNERTQSWRFINQLQKKYFLLLTATPMQNDLKELYNLINLIQPGQLGTYRSFQKRFMQDKRTPKNTRQLRELLAQVMIRNKRIDCNIVLPPRHLHAIPLTPSPPEAVLYQAVTDFVRRQVRELLQRKRTVGLLPLLTLQRELCSSSFAAALTLAKMADQAPAGSPKKARLVELYQLAMELEENTKAEVVVDLVRKINDKVVIFTDYRATQQYLLYKLHKLGIPVVGFDGSLSRGRKEWARYLFQREAQVLVSTESGGEGLNFQFCCQVINYDLPWNPMRLEQRIGRVHRLGQTREVQVFNLATRGTIEEHILRLLQEKISMFQEVIGDLDLVLSGLTAEGAIERRILELLATAQSEKELLEGFVGLGEELERELAQQKRARAEEVF